MLKPLKRNHKKKNDEAEETENHQVERMRVEGTLSEEAYNKYKKEKENQSAERGTKKSPDQKKEEKSKKETTLKTADAMEKEIREETFKAGLYDFSIDINRKNQFVLKQQGTDLYRGSQVYDPDKHTIPHHGVKKFLDYMISQYGMSEKRESGLKHLNYQSNGKDIGGIVIQYLNPKGESESIFLEFDPTVPPSKKNK